MALLTTSSCRNVVAVVMVTTRCMLKVCPSPSLSQCMLFPQSFSNSSPLSTIMSSKWLCCAMCHVCVVYFTARVTLPQPVFSARKLEELQSKYCKVSNVWHPLLSPVCKDSVCTD